MDKKNILPYGKNCIGESVIDCEGNTGTITGYQIAGNGKKVMVQISYADGTSHWREKFFVSTGNFRKPYLDKTKELLETGDWEYIPGFQERYIVCKTGEIRAASGKYKGKIKEPQKHTNGYKTVSLYNGSKKNRKLMFVHRIVAEAFIREVGPNEQVNHIDGDRTNNELSNLEIVTVEENNHKYLDLHQMGFDDFEIQRLKEYCRKTGFNTKQAIVHLVRRNFP